MNPDASVPLPDSPRRYRRWLWRLAFCVLALPPVVGLLAPYALRLPVVRTRLASELSTALGVPCAIEALSFSWFTGFAVGGVTLGNADGFDPSRPMLTLASLTGTLSLRSLFAGRVEGDLQVRGLRICVEQAADGSINLQRLRSPGADESSPTSEPTRRTPRPGRDTDREDRSPVGHLAFTLADSAVEVRRDGQPIESLQDIACTFEVPAPPAPIRLRFDAKLAELPQRRAGAVHVEGLLDPALDRLDGQLVVNGLDLARLEPLWVAMLPAGALTACQGQIEGRAAVAIAAADPAEITASGEFEVRDLRLAGGLLQGAELGIAAATLAPELHLTAAAAGPRVPLDWGRVPLRQPMPLLGVQQGRLRIDVDRLQMALDERLWTAPRTPSAPADANPAATPPAASSTATAPWTAWPIALDVAVRNANLALRRGGAVLETVSLEQLRATAATDRPLQASWSGTLTAPGAATPTTLRGELRADAAYHSIAASCAFAAVDLARMRTLAQPWLGDGALSACSGRLAGRAELEWQRVGDRRLTATAALDAEDLHLAGALLPGMDLRLARGHWTPSATLRGDGDGPRLPFAIAPDASDCVLQRLALQGSLAGLRLVLDRDALTAAAAPAAPAAVAVAPAGNGRADDPLAALARWPLDVSATWTDTEVELRRGAVLIEALRSRSGELRLSPETRTLQWTAACTLPAQGDQPEAALDLRGAIAVDGTHADGRLNVQHLALARLQPWYEPFVSRTDLTVHSGALDADLQLRVADLRAPDVVTSGTLTLQQPHLSGAWLHGLELRGERWTATPDLRWSHTTQRAEAGPGFALDLGCLRASALDAAATKALLGSDGGLGCAIDADLDALAAWGGPIPAELRGTGARVHGRVAAPLLPGAPLASALPPFDRLHTQLATELTVTAQNYAQSGFRLAPLAATVALRHGQLDVTALDTTRLNDGPIALHATADLTDLDRAQLVTECDWKGGAVAGETAQLLRYLVPLLAGLEGKVADFAAGIDLKFALRGPLRKAASENWLQYGDHWSGDGALALRQGRIVPAASLRGLVQPLGELLGPKLTLGDDGALALDELTSAWHMEHGAIESRAMRWLAKGRAFGLTGRVRLDGAVELGLDLTPLLAAHKDGQKVLQVLGNQKLMANLGGTVGSPRLQLPDLGAILGRALLDPSEAAKGELDKLLKKGLDELLRGKNPRGGGKDR